MKWLLLVGISAQGGRVAGLMQLYSVDRKVPVIVSVMYSLCMNKPYAPNVTTYIGFVLS